MNFWNLSKQQKNRKQFDVVSIGSATHDVYIESPEVTIKKDSNFVTGSAMCFGAGAKVNVDDVHFRTGGSAVNTAVTFAHQGLKTSIFCKVGNDFLGEAIRKRLKEALVNTDNIRMGDAVGTAYSVIIHAPSGERSIFAYRGISSHIERKEFDFSLLKKTNWIFVSHLANESAKLFEPILYEANKRGVRVALNPGSTQLNSGEKFAHLLKYVDILFVNQEEASILTGIDFKKERQVFEKLDEWVEGIAVMTKGKNGVIISDGKTRWAAGILKEKKFIDRTGAGDAFAAAFTTAIIKGGTVEDALQLGSANATALLSAWGSNEGLLTIRDSVNKFGKLGIKKEVLS